MSKQVKSPTACTMHHVVEVTAAGRRIYPYRCSRCGGCFQCEHQLAAGRFFWACRDGRTKPTTPDPGVSAQ